MAGGFLNQEEIMGQKDFFYEIAQTKHPAGTTDREVAMRKVSNHYFKETARQRLKPIREIGYEEQKEKFYQELEEQKAYYRPFLSNHLSTLPMETQSLSLQQFEFRYCEKDECFQDRNRPDVKWENVSIPDYRGPAKEAGKWEGYYRTEFPCPEGWQSGCHNGFRMILAFQCVDYIAEVYLNGNYVGSHEGLFAPFSFDVTKYIRESNELVILCKNDIPILGEGEFLDGDKIYAATGPGWDDPQIGWHHCPAGAGVFGTVRLELRPEIYVDDIFVRPDLSKDSVEVRVGVINYTNQVKRDLDIHISIEPKNYEGSAIGSFEKKVTAVGPGKNEYRYFFSIEGYRVWNSDTPWLYGTKVFLNQGEALLSAGVQTTGLKEFRSDETSTPRGKFFLNGKPIMLRGANEMGHLQQCVMNGDFEQLIEDILIAKMCHMNYYRITQRPVQEEIYEYFDMLGMMHQCDFPLFGFLRRPQLCEALRQVEEMEHLVRKHVSTAMVTLINEPMCIRRTEDPNDKFSRRYEAKGHRHLLRDELEAFFAAARKVIYVQNPDRVVKNVEGDYDGPTLEGMPDFHTYTMWYTNHGEPIGRLMRGYLPPVKAGWMIGCGEYGAEGLDPVDLMRRRYPKEWLQCDEKGDWYPDRIVRAQTHSVQGDWYPEQHMMEDWVRESQKHQANATKLMTDAFRRRGDVINQTAIHLLIDAWPSGWMKTLTDCERTPKPAYFAYQESLIPLKVNLYTARTSAYEDETVPVEVWILNDEGDRNNVEIQAEIYEEGSDTPYAMYTESFEIAAADAQCAGILPVSFEQTGNRRTVTVQTAIFTKDGRLLHQEKIEIQVQKRRTLKIGVYTLGCEAAEILDAYQGKSADETSEMWLVSGDDKEDLKRLEEHLRQGKHALWLLPKRQEALSLLDQKIQIKSCGDLFFAAADGAYGSYPLGMLYNAKKDYIDATADHTIQTEFSGETLIYTYDKSGFQGSKGAKPHRAFVKKCSAEGGTLILCSLAREGRVGYNIGLDELLLDLLEQEG